MAEIFVIDKEGTLHPLDNQPYDTESMLQRLLADYPDLLAGELVACHTSECTLAFPCGSSNRL